MRIAARLEAIPAACQFVYEAALAAGLAGEALHHCQLVLDEACTNIIEHGYRGGDAADQMIDIVCTRTPEKFIIELADSGLPFNPFDRPLPDPETELSDRQPGGWGVYFIRKLMDEVTYERRDSRNHLFMAKWLTRSHNEQPPQRSENQVTVQDIAHGLTVITLAGRVDSSVSSELENVFTRHVENGHRQLILDMSDVEYISSSGLKLLVSMWKRARDLKGNLVMADLQPPLYEVLKLLGFDLVFTIFDSIDEATANYPS